MVRLYCHPVYLPTHTRLHYTGTVTEVGLWFIPLRKEDEQNKTPLTFVFVRINFKNDDFSYHQFFMSNLNIFAAYYAERVRGYARQLSPGASDLVNNSAIPVPGGVKLNDLY